MLKTVQKSNPGVICHRNGCNLARVMCPIYQNSYAIFHFFLPILFVGSFGCNFFLDLFFGQVHESILQYWSLLVTLPNFVLIYEPISVRGKYKTVEVQCFVICQVVSLEFKTQKSFC